MDAVKRTKIIALLPLALILLLYLVFGIGEMLGGDFGGIGHLLSVVILIGLMWAAWKFPQWMGIGFIIVAVLFTMTLAVGFFRAPDLENGVMSFFPLLVISLPLLISGVMLLSAFLRGSRGSKI